MSDAVEQNAQLAELREEIVRLTLLEVRSQASGEISVALNEALGKAVSASLSGELTRNEQNIKLELVALKNALLAEFRVASKTTAPLPFLSAREISQIAKEVADQLNGTLLTPQGPQEPQNTARAVDALPTTEPSPPQDGPVQDQDRGQDQKQDRGRDPDPDPDNEPGKPAKGDKLFRLDQDKLRLCIAFVLGIAICALLNFATAGRSDRTDASLAVSGGSQEALVELIESTAVLDDWLRKAAVNTQLDAERPVGEGIQADTRINLDENLDRVLQLIDEIGIAQDPAIATQVRELGNFRAALLDLATDEVPPKKWTPDAFIASVTDINRAAREKLGLPQSRAAEGREQAKDSPPDTAPDPETPPSSPATGETPAPLPAVRG